MIADADGSVSADVHSSVSGEVIKIEDTEAGSGYYEKMITIKVEGDDWEETIDRSPDIVREITASPEEIIRLMDQQVHLFIEDAEQSDDLTMLSIKYTPKHDEFIEKEEITLTNDIKHVKTLNAFVKSITDKLNIDTSQARNIKLAVEEAVVNAMDYAYPKDIEGNITVQVMYNENTMKFVIIDSGVAFDPTEATLADTSLSVEDRPVGGLGLLLVRKMMDSINYERINNQNTLTLITSYTKKQ